MKRLFAVLVGLVAPLPAVALSCMPFSPTIAFEQAAASETRYIVVHGALVFDSAKRPRSHSSAPAVTEIAGRVVGQSLTRAGFTTPIDVPVTLAMHCFGPWCTEVGPGPDALMFVEKNNSGYRLTTTPCTPQIFHQPSPGDLADMRRCLTQGCP